MPSSTIGVIAKQSPKYRINRNKVSEFEMALNTIAGAASNVVHAARSYRARVRYLKLILLRNMVTLDMCDNISSFMGAGVKYATMTKPSFARTLNHLINLDFIDHIPEAMEVASIAPEFQTNYDYSHYLLNKLDGFLKCNDPAHISYAFAGAVKYEIFEIIRVWAWSRPASTHMTHAANELIGLN